jgi:hypothetical protein
VLTIRVMFPFAARQTALLAAAPVLLTLLAGCIGQQTPTPTQSVPSPSLMVSPSASPSAGPTSTGEPTPSSEPPLSLPLPVEIDQRQVRVEVTPEIGSSGKGHLTIRVHSLADRRVRELVLRFPTDLARTIFLAPFEPSESRIAEFGPPLFQEWTKWVVGPGESGEPAGTTSIGWGPLDPGATLTIPLVATRNAQGAVTFDLQVMAGESILTLPSGEPAELRVRVPG